MAVTDRFWNLKKHDSSLIEQLRKQTGYSSLLCKICVNRGLVSENEIQDFININTDRYSDFSLTGIPAAAGRIVDALQKKQRIVIYGDYDVDGITSTALMAKVLAEFAVCPENIMYYIPERQNEGYGLNSDALDYICNNLGADLIITVDCGISAVTEIEEADKRMDIIVTDHHQPPGKLPDAYAVVNPKTGCSYPGAENLAGVGVALKLCQELCRRFGSDCWRQYLDIVAIGTIADMVSLTGENRAIVKCGLEMLANTGNTGLQALMEVSGITRGHAVSAENVGFGIAPRLNAAGRLSQASLSVELLLTADGARAETIARALNDENSLRQQLEREIFEQADALIIAQGRARDPVIVLSGEWHSGVIGIVASRLVSKYYRPVIMISLKGETGKGSCRSIHSFNLYEALSGCADLLSGFGGHYMAAGLTVLHGNIELLRERLIDIASKTLSLADYYPQLEIDAEIDRREITLKTCRDLKLLEPYGIGNNRPVFAIRNIERKNHKVSFRVIGSDKRHLKITFPGEKGEYLDALCWDMADAVPLLENAARFSLAAAIESNVWRNVESVQLKTHSIIDEDGMPDRDVLVSYYTRLRTLGGRAREVRLSGTKMLGDLLLAAGGQSVNGLETALKIFAETGLIDWRRGTDGYLIRFAVSSDKKVELNDSSAYTYSHRQRQLLSII